MPNAKSWIAGTAIVFGVPAVVTIKSICRRIGGRIRKRAPGVPLPSLAPPRRNTPLPPNVIDPRSLL